MPDPNPDPKEEKRSVLRDYVNAEAMVQLGIALPAGCVIGWLAGSWLDRHFHQHWMEVAGILVGAAGGFVQIIRAASRYLKKNQ